MCVHVQVDLGYYWARAKRISYVGELGEGKIRVKANTHAHTYITHTYIHTYPYIHIYTHTPTYTHACIHTYMHMGYYVGELGEGKIRVKANTYTHRYKRT